MNAEDGEADDDCPNGYDSEGNCIEDEAEEEVMSARTPKSVKKTEITEFNKLKKDFSDLKKKFNKSAASTNLNTNKFSGPKIEKLSKDDLSKMSASERYLYKISN